jgi:hypothetical protein
MGPTGQLLTRGRRGRRPIRAVVALSAAVVMSVNVAGMSAADSTDLQPAEISSSDNIKQMTNVPRQGVNSSDFHSDLAFWGDVAVQGTYGGLNFYDIEDPDEAELVGQLSCPGGQGGPSVSPDGSLVFVSVDFARSDSSCQSTGSSAANPDSWEGIRIIDITDLSDPEQVATVRTDCGAHTHTLVPGDSDDVVYLYVSSYSPNATYPNCQPPHDAISIVEVPLDDPAAASVVEKPVLFPDGGASGTAGCSDITVFPERGLAAGACMGEGVLIDISDPVAPYVIDSVTDSNVAFWESATFSNDGSRVVFADQLGGGIGNACTETAGPERGADVIFDVVGEGDDRALEFVQYFKIGRHQQEGENCAPTVGSIVPVKGRDIMVQAWYQGGVSVWEFTDPENPVEIAYFEHDPMPEVVSGSWAAYWYNGRIFSSDITEGLDVLKLSNKDGFASANRVRQSFFNPRTQYTLSRGIN